MPKQTDFWSLLKLAQEHISGHYAAALTDPQKLPQLGAYLEKYLRDQDITVQGYDDYTLVNRLYSEMAEYSILTPYLGNYF